MPQVVDADQSQPGSVEAIVERVKQGHPYEVPGISARPIVAGNHDYLEWIADETASRL